MKQIQCGAGAIFIDGDNNILLEDRCEIKEELNYDLQDYEFFTEYNFQVDDLDLTYHMLWAKMPGLGEPL